MLRTAFKWIYRLGLRKDYARIDRLHYLKRLRRRRHPLDNKYYVSYDKEQFVAGEREREVCIADNFLGKRVVFLCDPSYHFDRKIIQQGFVGHPILDIMAAYVQPNSIVIDVGANDGVYAVPLAAAHPNIWVHAFEPNPAVVERLNQNIRLNQLSNLLVHPVAVSETAGQADFYQFDKDISLSSLNRYAAEKCGSPQINRVQVETIDSVFANRPERICFIKVDVQGAELKVFLGAKEVISSDRPVLLFEQEDVHFETAEAAHSQKMQIADFLSGHKYECFYITRYDHRLMFPVDWSRPVNGDVLALPVV